MGGFDTSSDATVQTVMYADNVCFDGTSRDTLVTADGELLIGASSAPFIRPNTLTSSDGTITITNGPGTIDLKSNGADLYCAQWIVDKTGLYGGNKNSIQSAINSASSGDIIFVYPDTYTEDLTLKAGVNITSFGVGQFVLVNVVGNHTFSQTGEVGLFGIRFEATSGSIFTLSGANNSRMRIYDCKIIPSNGAVGFNYTNSSAFARAVLDKCFFDTSDATTKLFTHSGTKNLIFLNCTSTNGNFTGTLSTSASTISSGKVYIYNSDIAFPITSSGTGAVEIKNSSFSSTYNQTFNNIKYLTLGGSGAQTIVDTYLDSGTAVSISVNSASTISNCTIKSSNASAIDGSSTISYNGINFSGSSSVISTTTQTPLITSNDAIKVTTPGAYPYTVIDTDALIKVDTSLARGITLPASPSTGQRHIIKDTVGSAATNNITVTPSAGNVDGAATYTINIDYGSATFVYSGSEWSVV